MSPPMISFVVTVYNRQKLIGVCLDTLINSGLRDYEVLVVDDASTDETVHVVDGYTKQHSHIRLHHLDQNRGPGFARNYGAKNARGRFLYFIDSDDTVDVAALPRLLEILGKNPAVDIVAVNYTHITPSGEKELYNKITREGLFTAIDFLDVFPYQIAMPLWMFVFNRDFFLSCGLEIPETYNMEDMCFTTYALLTAKTIYALPISAYKYHWSVPGSLATQKNFQRNLEGFAACCKMFAMLPEPNDRYRPHYRYGVRICTINMVFIIDPDSLPHDLAFYKNNASAHEPDWQDCKVNSPQAFIAQWIGYFCRNAQTLATKSGKTICLAPATRGNVRIAHLLEKAGCDFAGFFDNSPSVKNPNAGFCQAKGYDVFNMKSIEKQTPCLPIIFSHAGGVSEVLERQLTTMGLQHGEDFLAVYHR